MPTSLGKKSHAKSHSPKIQLVLRSPTYRVRNSFLYRFHILHRKFGRRHLPRPQLHPISAGDRRFPVGNPQSSQYKLRHKQEAKPHRKQKLQQHLRYFLRPTLTPRVSPHRLWIRNNRWKRVRIISPPAARQEQRHQRDSVAERVMDTENRAVVRQKQMNLPKRFIGIHGRRNR